jgi:hypothetical protein
MRVRAGAEGVAVDADPRPRRHLRADLRIVERHGVIAGMRDFRRVREPRAIAGTRSGGIAWIERDGGARYRHHQHVAEIGMACPRKMRVAEALDGRIVVAIARRMAVAFADLATRVGVGAELHHAERRAGTGEGMPLPARADERIGRIVRRCLRVARWGGTGGRLCAERGRKRRGGKRQHEEGTHARVRAANLPGANTRANCSLPIGRYDLWHVPDVPDDADQYRRNAQ